MYKVYLAGPIIPVDLETAMGWRRRARQLLELSGISAYSPIRGTVNLLPNVGRIGSDITKYQKHPLTTASGMTARDRYDVQSSDLIIANLLNATEKTCGTAIEFGWADAFGVPVIMVIEPSGSLAEHPMLSAIAEFRVSNMDDACVLTAQILLP